MERIAATKFLRETLDANGLSNWHIRLVSDLRRKFLGMCVYKDKCIVLNSLHIDTHPDEEIKETILHEVAHALTEGAGHNDVWKSMAIHLGCKNPGPCASFGFDEAAIDAIRSGADLKVEFEEHIVRTPKYTISRLQDKCPTCGKVAKTKNIYETELQKLIFLECGHLIVKEADSTSRFQDIVFDGDESCQHIWNKTICMKCNAKKLYPFQIEGARAIERAGGRFAVFDEMGLGKTIQELAYLYFKRDERWPFLHVTKAGTLYQHAREIARVLGPKAFPQVLRTGRDKLIPGLNYICSYDLFRRLDLSQFKEAGIKTLILDECQAIKNPDSTRTQCIRKIAKEIPAIIPLSGTPWKNRGSEFFVVLNLLDPKQFYSYAGFKNRWVDTYWDGNKQKEGGIVDPIRFKEAIKHIAIRRERIEVLPELPLINRTKVLCEVPEYARSVYKKVEDELVNLYNDAVLEGRENSFATQGSILQYLVQMRQITGLAKVDNTFELATEFLENTDRKLAIFVAHIKCGEMLENRLTEWCAQNNVPPPLRLEGGMDPVIRAEIQDKFNGPDYRLLIASTLASGEGLNLQTGADCIMHERQWNPANEEQAEGRFIRIGQLAKQVNATYIHGDDTIDTELDAIVERKRIAFHQTMNKGEIATWNESDVIKELVANIANKRKKESKK